MSRRNNIHLNLLIKTLLAAIYYQIWKKIIFFITCQTKNSHNGIFGTRHIFNVSSDESVNIIMGTNVNWTLHRCTCQMTSITADTKDIEAINPDSYNNDNWWFLPRFFSLNIAGWGRFWWKTDWYWSLINSNFSQCEFLIFGVASMKSYDFREKLMNWWMNPKYQCQRIFTQFKLCSELKRFSYFYCMACDFHLLVTWWVDISISDLHADVNKLLMWDNWINRHDEEIL